MTPLTKGYSHAVYVCSSSLSPTLRADIAYQTRRYLSHFRYLYLYISADVFITPIVSPYFFFIVYLRSQVDN